MSRILWLSTADARGHLMRCQLVTRALRAEGLEVDVVTTSLAGQAFLRAFGVDAEVLSDHYRVEFDERQNMQRVRTEWRIFRYFASPARFSRDLDWLVARSQGADLVVNDSFHPALLLSPRFRRGAALPPIVHVYGRHLREAMEENFQKRWPAGLATFYRDFMAGCTDAAFGRIQHALDAPVGGREVGPRTFEVPPALAAPERDPEQVRAELGLAPGERLAVAYLNPHFQDPRIAEALERGAEAHGFHLHAVGEGYAGRPGWRAHDTRLADALSVADLFMSAPGLGALGQALGFGLPFLAVVTDQPEQRSNLHWLRDAEHPHREISVGTDDLAPRVDAAIAQLAATAAQRKRPQDGLETWVGVIKQLVAEAEARTWMAA